MSEESTIDHTSQGSLEEARKEGLRVILPEPKQLLIDIDTEANLETFNRNYLLLQELGVDLLGYSSRPSRRKIEGRHITVRLGWKPTVIERIALQAMLGSDLKREIYSFWRWQTGEAIPTMFFEKP